MPSSTLARLAPLTGVLGVLLVIAMFLVVGEPPDVDKSTAEVVKYWDNDKNILGAMMLTLAGVLLAWFGGSVRVALRHVEGEPGRVTAIAFGGFLAFGFSFALFGGIEFAAAETARDVPGEVTHTLAVMDAWVFLPGLFGLFLALVATAVVTLRHGGLPRWLAYVAILLAIVLLTPIGFFGFAASGIWIIITSILLYLRPEPDSSTT